MAHRRTALTDVILRILSAGPMMGPGLHTALMRAVGDPIGTSTFYAALASLADQALIERPAEITAKAAAERIAALAKAIQTKRARQLAIPPETTGYRLTPAGERRAKFALLRHALDQSELAKARSSLDELEKLCCTGSAV